MGIAATLIATLEEPVHEPTRLQAVTFKVQMASAVRELAVKEVEIFPVASTEHAAAPFM